MNFLFISKKKLTSALLEVLFCMCHHLRKKI